jgi:CRISPR-associated exonuclease Cas4
MRPSSNIDKSLSFKAVSSFVVDDVDSGAYLKVSEIPIYLSCPKKLYFHYQGKGVEPVSEQRLNNIFYKELSYNIHEIEATWDEGWIEDLLDEIELIHRDTIKEIKPEIFEAFKGDVIADCDRICEIAGRIHTFYAREGLKLAETGRFLRSHRLLLSGSLDKAMRADNASLVPVIVRGGGMPDNGVWKSDRMRIAAYTILLEEELGGGIYRGFVEYISEGEVREVTIRDYDRRRVLKLLRMMRRIKNGAIPDRLDSEACEVCSLQDACVVERSLLSRFF